MTRIAAQAERADPEHQEQAALFAHMEGHEHQFPQLGAIFAVPNGEYRPPVVGARLKAEGVKAGVLDICVPIPRVWNQRIDCGIEVTTDGWWCVQVTPGLWVEMKAPGRCMGINYGTSPEQRTWATIFTELGWRVVVVDDWKQAWTEIKDYLGINLKEDWL